MNSNQWSGWPEAPQARLNRSWLDLYVASAWLSSTSAAMACVEVLGCAIRA